MCQFTVARCPCDACKWELFPGDVLRIDLCPRRHRSMWHTMVPIVEPAVANFPRPAPLFTTPATCSNVSFVWIPDFRLCAHPHAAPAPVAGPMLPAPRPMAVPLPGVGGGNAAPAPFQPGPGLLGPVPRAPAGGPFTAGPFTAGPSVAPGPSAAPGLSAAPAPFATRPSPFTARPDPINTTTTTIARATHTTTGRKKLPSSRPRTERVQQALLAAAKEAAVGSAAAASAASGPAAATSASGPAAPATPVEDPELWSGWSHTATTGLLVLRSTGKDYEEISSVSTLFCLCRALERPEANKGGNISTFPSWTLLLASGRSRGWPSASALRATFRDGPALVPTHRRLEVCWDQESFTGLFLLSLGSGREDIWDCDTD